MRTGLLLTSGVRAEPTEHQGVGEGGHQDWRIGHTCDECTARAAAKLAASHSGMQVNFNISRLKSDNTAHVTQRQLGREVIESAKRDGREIERYR